MKLPVVLPALILIGLTAGCQSTKGPETWDGLSRVDNKSGIGAVYMTPGASFAKYRRVMIDEPVEVAFDKNWDPNQGRPGLPRDIDPDRIRKELGAEFIKVFKRELETEGKYPVVTETGDDVLRVRAAIVNLYINAPDTMEPGTRSYVMDAGHMTLVAELYDSRTNALLARAVDTEQGTDMGRLQVANSVTNSADARLAIEKWADALRKGLERAKAGAALAPPAPVPAAAPAAPAAPPTPAP